MSTSNAPRQKRARLYAQSAKNVPCADCGVAYPYFVMDFDHRGDKVLEINRLVKRGPSLVSLQSEIDKCDVVCSNCHRARTFLKRNQVGNTTVLQ